MNENNCLILTFRNHGFRIITMGSVFLNLLVKSSVGVTTVFHIAMSSVVSCYFVISITFVRAIISFLLTGIENLLALCADM